MRRPQHIAPFLRDRGHPIAKMTLLITQAPALRSKSRADPAFGRLLVQFAEDHQADAMPLPDDEGEAVAAAARWPARDTA